MGGDTPLLRPWDCVPLLKSYSKKGL